MRFVNYIDYTVHVQNSEYLTLEPYDQLVRRVGAYRIPVGNGRS